MAPGLEPLTAAELSALGEQPRAEDGGVAWNGDARSIMRANLWLRTASRVLVRMASFRAKAFYELETRAKKLPWAEFITPGRPREFRVTARKSRLYHSDAIAERLMAASGATAATAASAPADAGTQLFVVRVVRDEFTISVDTSGELLHMRGYRQQSGKAPLRETLAAALLLAAGWLDESGTPRGPLLDPFCGSGTIPIEGALIARRVAPGSRRRFAFMEWPSFYQPAWNDAIADAKSGALASSPVVIRGSDRDRGAIEASLANAARAGVGGDIHFDVRALSAIQPPGGAGLIATNPPYGVRVGDARALRDLYARFGQVVRERCPDWSVAMYSPRERYAAETALDLASLFETTNGGIRVSALGASGRFLHS